MTERKLSRRAKPLPLLAIVLAGGRGTRLYRLTDERCKPALPFGKNQLTDFAIANVVNSRVVDDIMVLAQYQLQGIIDHFTGFDFISRVWKKSAKVFPAQQQLGESWYEGTANAVYQNHKYIRNHPADTVVILAADHIYKLDIEQMRDFHRARNAQITVCGLPLPITEARGNYGVMELNNESRISGFEEKPQQPKPLPGTPDTCFASMGIYIMDKNILLDLLEKDHSDEGSQHDFGKNLIPMAIKEGVGVYGYDFTQNEITNEPQVYWRDVGRIGPYWEALMDLATVSPALNMYNDAWPIPTGWDMQPQFKSVYPDRKSLDEHFSHIQSSERGMINVLASGGTIVDSPCRIVDSILGRSVRTEFGVDIEKSVLFDGARVGRFAQLRFTIVEEGVLVPDGVRIGFDLEEDKRNGVYIDEGHNPDAWHPPIRIVTKEAHFGR